MAKDQTNVEQPAMNEPQADDTVEGPVLGTGARGDVYAPGLRHDQYEDASARDSASAPNAAGQAEEGGTDGGTQAGNEAGQQGVQASEAGQG